MSEKETKDIVEKLKEMMRAGNVSFTYLKKDGTERHATGTLSTDIIPSENQPKSEGERNMSEDILRYYDVDKEGWRSCIKANIVSIDEKEAV